MWFVIHPNKKIKVNHTNPQPVENDFNRFTFLDMYSPGFPLLMFFTHSPPPKKVNLPASNFNALLALKVAFSHKITLFQLYLRIFSHFIVPTY